MSSPKAGKNILVVSSSFYPENSPRSFRTTELVKEFARQGHEVTLLTLKKDEVHKSFEQEHGINIKDIGPLRLPEIKFKAKAKITHLLERAIHRGMHLFFEYPDIELMYRVKKGLVLESGYDLMISIAVPHPIHWGVAWARTNNHPIANTWVADCGDPYMGFKLDRFGKPFYFKYLEKMFCSKADYISVPIEGAKEAYYKEFRHKIEVIPQGFKFEEVEVNQNKCNENETPIFGYAGNLLGGNRNPFELLDYLVNLDRDFKFIIYTQNRSPVVPYLSKADGKIEIRDYIPRNNLLKELSKMDFLVNLENATSRQAPSKLIDYYLTDRPVLSVPSSGLDIRNVDRFLKGDYRDRYQFKNMDRYRIGNVCTKFLDLCEN